MQGPQNRGGGGCFRCLWLRGYRMPPVLDRQFVLIFSCQKIKSIGAITNDEIWHFEKNGYEVAQHRC